ncbi:MAG: hypothetical protein O2894_10915 [Planctomycetota bacterium]|nr:hypothetical protein [Planctomycetota bacterium]
MIIVLAKNFTFSLSPGQAFTTDWVSFPVEHEKASAFIHTQTMVPAAPGTGLTFEIETSFDTAAHPTVGAPMVIPGVGSANQAITSGLGPMVRLLVTNGDIVAIHTIASVWLVPKSD